MASKAASLPASESGSHRKLRPRNTAPQPTPSTSQSTPTVVTVQPDSVLGTKTRTQFKLESYEAVKTSGDSSVVPEVQDPASTTSQRAVVDFSCVQRFLNKLCCPVCKEQTLIFKTDSKQNCGYAIYSYDF